MSPCHLKLYQSNASPNSRRVRIFLAEKAICVCKVPVDLGEKEQFSEAFAKINPRRVVPALLIEDGTVIAEVPAIQHYLEETHAGRPMLGSTAKERAVIAMWDRRMELEGFAAVMETVRNQAAGLKGRAMAGSHGYEQIPALVERGRLRVINFHADLEERLGQATFVAGDRFTAADITAVVTIDFATRALSLAIPEGHAATRRWYDLVSARPSMTA